MNKTFLILGGYGNSGRLIAELLLKETDLKIIISGRDIEKAKALTYSLNQAYKGDRVSALRADASDYESLKSVFKKTDLVVVASSTTEYVGNAARAVIETGIDYLDTQLSTKEKLDVLKSLKTDMENTDCCFITDGGFHPGVPAALVRYAASNFDQIEKANIGSVIQLNWKEREFSKSTSLEMIEEFKNYQPIVYKNGSWIKLKWKEYLKFNFRLEFGTRLCAPMYLEEMKALPAIFPSLRETGFYVAGFNWFIDYIGIPLVIIALAISEKLTKPLSKFFEWGLKTFSKPPYGTMLTLQAAGLKNEKHVLLSITLFHKDAYMLTAIPVVACLLQYLEMGIRKPGLWFQAHFVDPKKFVKDIQRLGVQILIEQISSLDQISLDNRDIF